MWPSSHLLELSTLFLQLYSTPPPLFGRKTIPVFDVAVWRSGNGIGRIYEVTLRLAWLVLGWVTVFGQTHHLGN